MFEGSLRLVVWLVPVIVLAVIILPQMIRILREYERGVIFRLGKLLGTKGPGLIFLIPIVDRMVRMDLARRDHRRRAPGSHDTGQRADDRGRRRLFPRHRSSGCGRASGEIPEKASFRLQKNSCRRHR